MCAVIGISIQSPSLYDFDQINDVFHQSSIRGLHATGFSFIKNGMIETRKSPEPSDIFFRNKWLRDCVNEDGNLYMIGHCRYSTSDLEFNQPIYNNEVSIVHNGVISQDPPDLWRDKYGYECETKNDSELVLQAVLHDKDPLIEYQDASMAVCELHAKTKTLKFYRNGKRPLYYLTRENGCIVISTADIGERSGIRRANKTIAGMQYTFKSTLNQTIVLEIKRDLQS